MKVYKAIANKLVAIKNCELAGNYEWFDKHGTALHRIMDTAPSGSGFDIPITIKTDKSSVNRIVLEFEYHHMNEVGFYTKWTAHKVTIKPSLAFGFTIHCTRNRACKEDVDYFCEVLEYWLDSEYEG